MERRSRDDGIRSGTTGIDDRLLARQHYSSQVAAPEMLHAAVVRSPHARARILRIDTTQVGLDVVVLTPDDLRDLGGRRYGAAIKDEPILAEGEARYVGEPVAAVAAATPALARRAADSIVVDYEVLPPALGGVAAAQPGAPLVHEGVEITAEMAAAMNVRLRPTPDSNICHTFRLQQGRADWEALADVVVEHEYHIAGAAHMPLEPHAVLASWRGDRLYVEGGTQTPFSNRDSLAELFGLPTENVQVSVVPMGGSFGAKTFLRVEPIVAGLARKGGRPVKIVLSRVEEFLTLNRHPATFRIRLGAAADGTLVGKTIDAWWDTGAYADAGPDVATKGGYASIGPYRIPNIRLESRCVYTNTVPNGAYRGYAATQAVWASERCMDELADKLDMDPLELRLRNLLDEGEAFATGEVLHDFHIKECLLTAAAAVGWEEGRSGKGLAVVMKGMHTPSLARARIEVADDGRLRVHTGTTEFGQRVDLVQTELAATALGMPRDRFVMSANNTDLVPFDARTTSSRSTHMMSTAIAEAADDLIRSVADKLAVPSADLTATPSGVRTKDGETPWTDLTGLSGAGEYSTTGGLDPDTGAGIASSEWHQGAAAVAARLDEETGLIEITALHTATWAGRVVERLGAELQTEGGMIMGLGTALFEEVTEDEDGQPQQLNLSDYNIPSMLDVPAFDHTLLEGGPEATVHGLGETAMPPVPAALGNALHTLGAPVRRLPLTPERVIAALEERP